MALERDYQIAPLQVDLIRLENIEQFMGLAMLNGLSNVD